ncbi:hypothetical protein GCM10009796_08240 [Microbacterium koreense]
MVRMLVRQDDGDHRGEVVERERERARIDEERAAFVVDAQRGMFVFRDSHDSSQSSPRRLGKHTRPDLARVRAHVILERLC